MAAHKLRMYVIEFVMKYWWAVVGISALLAVMSSRNAFPKKDSNIQPAPLATKTIDEIEVYHREEDKVMGTTDNGYVNKNNQRNNGRTDIPGTDFGQWFYDMECLNCGHKYHANGSNIYEKKCPNCQITMKNTKSSSVANGQKSTDKGYVNKNNQRNNGKTNLPGTGNGQWFYDMECLDCGHTYHANGHDIWLRKCPKCQGGRP